MGHGSLNVDSVANRMTKGGYELYHVGHGNAAPHAELYNPQPHT